MIRSRLTRALAGVAAAMVVVLVPASAGAAPGGLDPGFGSSGVVLTPGGAGGSTGANGVLRQTDGKLVVAGTGTDAGGNLVTKVARYTSSGQLDTSFGDGSSGITTLPAFSSNTFVAAAVAQEPGGDLIVAGTLLSGSGATSGDFALVALDPTTGALDTSWGSSGIVHTQIGDAGGDNVTSVVVDSSSGDIFVGGSATVGGVGEFAVAGYDAGGAALSGFGSSGQVLTAVSGGDAQVTALTLDGTDLLAAGTAQSGGAAELARYSAAGALQTGFPVPVTLGPDSGSAASSLLVQTDGQIVVGGYGVYPSGSCLALARLNPDGSADTGFGHAGYAHLCPGLSSAANAVVASADGLYATGYELDASGHTQVLLARFDSAGAADAGFGSGGVVSSYPNGTGNDAQANAITLDGVHPVVVGEVAAGSQTDYVLERYTGGTLPVDGSPPTVSAAGTLTAGQTLTGSAGTWTGTAPISYTYTWLRCPGTSATGCTTVQSGGGDRYTLKRADAGRHMLLAVTGANVAGSATAYAQATAVVLAPPASISPPAIAGTAAVAGKLRASPGGWSGSQPVSYTFKWRSCPTKSVTDSRCRIVQSGSSSTYVPGLGDASRHLAVTVKATNSVGSATATSAFTGPVGLGNLRIPKLTGCGERVIIGPIVATGCLKRHGQDWVATGDVAVNGIFLLPDGAGAKVVFDPRHLTISTTAAYDVQIGPVLLGKHKFGPWQVYKGKFKWDFSADGLPHLQLPHPLPKTIRLPGRLEASLPAIPFPALPALHFLGLPVVGTPTIKPAGGGVTLTLPVGLPKVLGGISGRLVLHADQSTGLTLGGISVAVPDVVVPPVEIKGSSLSWQPDTGDWSAATTVVLPTPNRTSLGASLVLAGNHLKSIAVDVAHAQIPLGPGAFLQTIDGSLGFSPLHIGGSVGISAGPTIAGQSAASIDGALTYDLGKQTSKLQVNGTLTLMGLKLAQASIEYLTDHGAWSLRFGGQLGYQYTIHGPFGTKFPIGAAGSVTGAIYGASDFYLEAKAQIVTPLINAFGDVRANRHALAGCAAIGSGWHQLAAGFVYRWGGTPQPFAGCSIGQYVSDSHGAHAAGGRRSLRLPAGLPMAAIRVIGASGPPVVKLTGPHHASLTVPATGNGLKTSHYLAFRDPENDTTYLMINHPAGGVWSVAPAAGSPAIVRLQSAEGLPAPRVRAKLGGSRTTRYLRYSLTPHRGQRVRFVARGARVSEPLGVAHGSHGRIRFHPAAGSGRVRVIAEVLQDGAPRATLTVAHYRAPRSRRLRAPRRVRAARRHGRIVVTFSHVGGAGGYLVRLNNSIGPSVQRLVGAHSHRVVVRGVLPQARVRVLVRARDRFGALGKPHRARLAPQRPGRHHRHHKHHHRHRKHHHAQRRRG